MNQIPLKRGSLRLSQGLLVVFALLLLALDVLGRRVITWFLLVSHGLGGLRDGILLGCTLYACSVCAWIAAVALWKLLWQIDRGEVFTERAVRYLRVTGWCCFGVCAITLVSILYYRPMLLPALASGFIGAIVRVVMSAFEGAVSMREELDLTV